MLRLAYLVGVVALTVFYYFFFGAGPTPSEYVEDLEWWRPWGTVDALAGAMGLAQMARAGLPAGVGADPAGAGCRRSRFAALGWRILRSALAARCSCSWRSLMLSFVYYGLRAEQVWRFFEWRFARGGGVVRRDRHADPVLGVAPRRDTAPLARARARWRRSRPRRGHLPAQHRSHRHEQRDAVQHQPLADHHPVRRSCSSARRSRRCTPPAARRCGSHARARRRSAHARWRWLAAAAVAGGQRVHLQRARAPVARGARASARAPGIRIVLAARAPERGPRRGWCASRRAWCCCSPSSARRSVGGVHAAAARAT